MFKGEKGAALAAELGKKSKTFTPGAPVGGAAKPAPSPQVKQDMEAIKVKVNNSCDEGVTVNGERMKFIQLPVFYPSLLARYRQRQVPRGSGTSQESVTSRPSAAAGESHGNRRHPQSTSEYQRKR